MSSEPTDYQAELAGIDREIADLDSSALYAGADAAKRTRSVYLGYRRASLTGDESDLRSVATAVADAIRQFGVRADLCLVKANTDLKRHRVRDARRDIESCPILAGSPQGRTLLADIDYQLGRYDEARRGYELSIREDPTWDALVRLAYLHSQLGDIDGAERLYVEAEDEITAKEMRGYAWVQLQRGRLQLVHGRYEQAGRHYHTAERAYSGYWLTDSYIAELLGARGDLIAAADLYERLLSQTSRPDLHQALGDLYLRIVGRTTAAAECHARALAGYLGPTGAGEVHYFHHLASFHADVSNDGAEAVTWARRDLELRENFSTQAMLAWALYREGGTAEASGLMARALASGVVDAGIFIRAATIESALGRATEAEQLVRRAREVDPNHRDFRAHG